MYSDTTAGANCCAVPVSWRRMPRPSGYYHATISDFLSTPVDGILGSLARAHAPTLEPTQRDAWVREIGILKDSLAGLDGTLYLEFDVPRLGSRIDAVVIVGSVVFPIEFKCGATTFDVADWYQAWDYALDLKNFHLSSHGLPLLPVLVATEAGRSDETWDAPHSDGVHPPRRSSADNLARVLREGIELHAGALVDGLAWGRSPYHPTPTIVEAARTLYAGHAVEEITRSDADATNLSVTSSAVEEIIDRSRTERRKAIVFVTGVPGAGKTLVGLNVATRREGLGDARAVFLSGNGPLVRVLQTALARDAARRRKEGERRGDAKQAIKAFIQNIHHFRDEGVRSEASPSEHAVIFDEAQRAWDQAKTASFMKRRKGVENFSHSEPEFLISYMDRHRDWAVIVCLVGGGQEIHDGEAGIAAWLQALRDQYPHWDVYVSPNLTDSEYAASDALQTFPKGTSIVYDGRLHLSSSMRSFRSEKVSAFVKALLDRDVDQASTLASDVTRRYPIAVTRDLAKAKAWIRDRARGSERYGLVASSQAARLKPHAIDVRVESDPVHYFLNGRDDIRSSYYMEDVATEFQVQGLELDWVCVTWDADLRASGQSWVCRSFKGKKWQAVKKPERQRYLLNAYRVLLTRARQGMVIFVPPGDSEDTTRAPEFYDGTYSYLRSLGIAEA